MLEFFQFATSSFWTFCGTVILLWILLLVLIVVAAMVSEAATRVAHAIVHALRDGRP